MKQYERDGQTIFRGDALEVLEGVIGDASVDLVFADPPYNIGKNFNGNRDRWESVEAYLAWCRRWLDLCVAKLRDNGSMYVMASTQCMPLIDLYLRDKMSVISRIVWCYDSSGVQAKKCYGSLYEPILFCVKDPRRYTFNAQEIAVEARTGAVRKLIDYRKNPPRAYNTHKVPGNVWEFPRVRYRMPEYEQHPSQKPVALLERIIRASSNPGDTVLDPFSGTFTTSFVARELGRKSIGIELDAQYVRAGLRRLSMSRRDRA